MAIYCVPSSSYEDAIAWQSAQLLSDGTVVIVKYALSVGWDNIILRLALKKVK